MAARRGQPLAALALLVIAMAASPAGAADAEFQALFDRLDSNRDGQLASDEIPAEKDRLFKRLLRTADADHDGKLSKPEFVAGLTAPAIDRANDGERAKEYEQSKKCRHRRIAASSP